jgi:hypothetical protein
VITEATQRSQALERGGELLQTLRLWKIPTKTLTGIAFLIVCDMLLTGFDAPWSR